MQEKGKISIKDVYLTYSEEQFLELKKEKINDFLEFLYKFLFFIIITIYLVGSFLIISLKKSFFNLFVSSLKCRLDIFCNKEEFKKQANFFVYIHEQLLREPIDLNLIMFWNFIGITLSNSLGLRPSSFIFLIINILIFLLTYNIDYKEYVQETCQYSYLKILLFFFNWMLMAFSFGASSLLAQQKFIDYYSLFDKDSESKEKTDNDANDIEYQNIETNIINDDKIIINESIDTNLENDDSINIKKNKTNEIQETKEIELNNNENIKNKINKQKHNILKRNFGNLFMLSIAFILGYAGKNWLAIGFSYYNQNFEKNTIYNSTDNLTNIININYDFYSNNSGTNSTNNTNFFFDYEINKNIFIFFCLIYIGIILISVMLLYSIIIKCFFKKKSKIKENNINNCCTWNIACELCGFVIYNERIVLDKDERENQGFCKLCCESLNNYCDTIICNMCNCKEDGTDDCCCCCNRYNEKHFEKEKQIFCYCYQEKSCFDWINKFFVNRTQKEIIFNMILYFISRLLIIGSEANYKNKLKDIDFSDAKQMFGYAVLAVINYIISCCPERKKQNINDSTKEDKQPFTDEYFIELFFISIGFNYLIGFVY